MKFRNLTPHAVNINGLIIEPDPADPARCIELREHAFTIADIRFERVQYGAVQGVPDREDGTMLIVSAMVRAACPDRDDLCSPGTLIRDDAGKIVGCSSLTVN